MGGGLGLMGEISEVGVYAIRSGKNFMEGNSSMMPGPGGPT